MRELTENEIDEVSGGFLPVVAFGLAVAAKIGLGSTASVAGWAIGSAGLVLASYSLAEYLDDRGSREPAKETDGGS